MNKLENNNLIIEIKNNGAELTRIYSKSKNIDFLWMLTINIGEGTHQFYFL